MKISLDVLLWVVCDAQPHSCTRIECSGVRGSKALHATIHLGLKPVPPNQEVSRKDFRYEKSHLLLSHEFTLCFSPFATFFFCCIQVTHKGTLHKLRWHCSIRHGDVLLAAPGNHWNNLLYLASGDGAPNLRLAETLRVNPPRTRSIHSDTAAISDPHKNEAKSWHIMHYSANQWLPWWSMHGLGNKSTASGGAQHHIWLQSRPSTMLQNL